MKRIKMPYFKLPYLHTRCRTAVMYPLSKYSPLKSELTVQKEREACAEILKSYVTPLDDGPCQLLNLGKPRGPSINDLNAEKGVTKNGHHG